ncbi:DUF3108 domain-containing protein [Variovorax sp. RTB1]|uniref:DUF3108 domain-containing protein n=1 Tax=Variovorax sp. RTB1 TaxID=3048631 RepID=UPI002B226B7E|nr:DUF3108 domain-containing protein [Variovorax sp. RTB1]MEB0110763.1 DUF3108 domain-containing protein [Variovorax sp. RTB1]
MTQGEPAALRPTPFVMSSLTAPPLPDLPRPPWRALVVVTLAVALVHLALLGLTPMAVGPQPAPLAGKFSTRTIVIAPPPSAEPAAGSAATPAQAATPAAASAPKPVHPRAARTITPPKPRAPVETPRPPPPPVEIVPQPAVEPVIEPAAKAPAVEPTPADTTAATAPEAAASAPGGSGGAASAGNAGSGTSPQGAMTGPTALRVPGSVQLAFAVTGQQGASPMQGVFGRLDWLQDGNAYDARLALTFLFRTLRTQHSRGVIGPTGIEPERFSDNRKTEVASHFVRDQGKVVFSNNAPSVPLLAGAQDRLSVVLQLGAMLSGNPARYPAGSAISVQTVSSRDAEIWTFNVEGEEKLSLPAGDFTVRKLTRSPRREFDDRIELWLAPDLGYLPVRIKQTQPNGDFADMQLREQLAMKPPG